MVKGSSRTIKTLMTSLLRLFEYTNTESKILDLSINDQDKIIDECAIKYAQLFIADLNQTRTPAFQTRIYSATIDHLASTHCDKWLEGTSLHFMLYTGHDRPELDTSNSGFADFRLAKYRGYSGDVSGVIGEALLGLVLTRIFRVPEYDFAHFGSTSVIYPDFGVYQPTIELKAAAQRALSSLPDFQQSVLDLPDYVMPVEVKAMATPDYNQLRLRMAKALRQLRSFWRTRDLRDSSDAKISRGTSLLFVAMRNPLRLSYDGFFLWMT